jgi:hypothetical protein
MYGQIQEFYTLRDLPGSPGSVNLDLFPLQTSHVANANDPIDRVFMVPGTQLSAVNSEHPDLCISAFNNVLVTTNGNWGDPKRICGSRFDGLHVIIKSASPAR